MPAKRVQLNVHISTDLAARLDNMAAAYKKRSRTHIAEEIIEQCVEIYEKSEVAKFDVLQRAIQNVQKQ